jgi:hypothetical protein
VTAPAPRYPFASLLRLLHCDESTVKSRLGLDHRQVARYLREGLTERRACELAAIAGVHEYDAWHEMTDHRIAASSKQCADCPAWFVPSHMRPDQRFCSDRCRQRQWLRNYRRTPEGKAKHAEYDRRYYAECGDYVRARERRKYRRSAA